MSLTPVTGCSPLDDDQVPTTVTVPFDPACLDDPACGPDAFDPPATGDAVTKVPATQLYVPVDAAQWVEDPTVGDGLYRGVDINGA